MLRRSRQLTFVIRTWGGRREGACRKPGPGRLRVPHRRRAVHDARCPAHVTFRATIGIPSLRGEHVFAAVRSALAAASSESFRLLQFSVQSDHMHLLVEADGSADLRRGLQGLAIRAAKAVNRALGRRGTVWGDRYHVRLLATPREVRNALIYVLNNWRKHIRGTRGFDPRSSAAWFDGWRSAISAVGERSPVAKARTWLARIGWRRHGLVEVQETPRGAPRG